ncbi:MAG: peptide deformylase [Meiothermus sp.]
MAEILPIRLYGDPILKKKALPVQDFSGIPQLAENMFESMFEARGVGLAAPQIGLSRRIFVAAEYLDADEDEEEGKEAPLKTRIKETYVMVNPKITYQGGGKEGGLEGCLSVPGVYVDDVPRDLQVKVEYQDEKGEKKVLEAEGYLARIFQHEIDHLDGIMYFQRLPFNLKQKFLEENREDLADFQRQAKTFLKEQSAKR